MSGLTADKMTNLYADLTSQISKSVKSISQKSASTEFQTPAVAETTENSPASTNVNFSGYAFSYLEPSSLYNLHQIKTDLRQTDVSGEEKRKQNLVSEGENQPPAADNDNQEHIEQLSFADELQNSQKLNARFITRLYQQNILNKTSEIPLFLSGGNFTQNDIKYANNAYNYTFKLNNIPDMRIEYMHKYNRSFDYRI